MELKVLKPFTHFNDGIVHALTDDGNVVDFDDEDKYWDMFECEEIEVAKPFDGHTDKDVERLLSLNVCYTRDDNIG